MVTTNQKSIIYRLTKKKNESKHNSKDSHQITREENKRGNKKVLQGFPGGAVVENLPANAGDTGSSPDLGRSHMPQSN